MRTGTESKKKGRALELGGFLGHPSLQFSYTGNDDMLIMPNGLEIEIIYNGDAVDACFDKDGSETFDLTKTAEVLVHGVMHQFSSEDELSMTVEKL